MNSVHFKRRGFVCFLKKTTVKNATLFTCLQKPLCHQPSPLDGGIEQVFFGKSENGVIKVVRNKVQNKAYDVGDKKPDQEICNKVIVI